MDLRIIKHDLSEKTDADNLMRVYGFPFGLQIWKSPLKNHEWALEYGSNERGLYLWGKSGAGKSVTTTLICRRWLEEWSSKDIHHTVLERQWWFVSCAKLVMEIQDAWRATDKSAYGILKHYAETPQLVLDDLGAEKPTEYVRQAFYFLINEREQWGRRTFITSNLTLERLAGQYDARIASRISGMCDVRELLGADQRQQM